MRTFKEYIEYRATRKNGIKKGTVVLVKIFDAEKDGPWSEEGRGLSHRPYDRTYVEARIGDYLQDKANCREFDAAKFDLTDMTYLIAVVVKKNTKRCNALIEYGFEPAIDLEQKAKALGGA